MIAKSLVAHLGQELHALDRRRVLVAFSGGLDSTVLLHLLVEHSSLKVFSAHIDHQVRESSPLDARWCQRQASAWKIPHLEARLSLDDQKSQHHLRYARYAALGRLADEAGAELIATAHHRDDMLETFAMAIRRTDRWHPVLRMSDFPAADKAVWRPLLDVPRASLEDYASAVDLEWIEDPTNRSDIYERNRVRKRMEQDTRWRQSVETRFLRSQAAAKLEPGTVRSNAFRAEISREHASLDPHRAIPDLADSVVGASVSSAALDAIGEHLRAGDLVSVSVSRAVVHLGRSRVVCESTTARGNQALSARDAGEAKVDARHGAHVNWFDWTLDFEPRNCNYHIRGPRAGDRLQLAYGSKKAVDVMRESEIDAFDRWRVPLVLADTHILSVADQIADGITGIRVSRECSTPGRPLKSGEASMQTPSSKEGSRPI